MEEFLAIADSGQAAASLCFAAAIAVRLPRSRTFSGSTSYGISYREGWMYRLVDIRSKAACPTDICCGFGARCLGSYRDWNSQSEGPAKCFERSAESLTCANAVDLSDSRALNWSFQKLEAPWSRQTSWQTPWIDLGFLVWAQSQLCCSNLWPNQCRSIFWLWNHLNHLVTLKLFQLHSFLYCWRW